MRKLRALAARCLSLFNKRAHESDLDEEIQSNLQFEIEDNVRSGMTPEEARRAALVKFGSLEATKDAIRDRRGLPIIETLSHRPASRQAAPFPSMYSSDFVAPIRPFRTSSRLPVPMT